MVAPSSASRLTIGRLGASRMSSVSGLNVRPSTAMVLPWTEPPAAWMTRAAMLLLRASLTATVASTRRDGAPQSCAIRISASVSFGKQLPPNPGPACKNFRPIRPSRPMPRATSCTSAPTFSHRSAISLMNVTFIAKNELAAYFVSSAVSSDVNRMGASIK